MDHFEYTLKKNVHSDHVKSDGDSKNL